MSVSVGQRQRGMRSGVAVHKLLERVAAKPGREAAGAGLQAPARTMKPAS